LKFNVVQSLSQRCYYLGNYLFYSHFLQSLF